MELHVPITERFSFWHAREGGWFYRVRGTQAWIPVNCDVVFDKIPQTLEERTIDAIDNMLALAPEYDEYANDDGHLERWESEEWAEAKVYLREILDEWKEGNE